MTANEQMNELLGEDVVLRLKENREAVLTAAIQTGRDLAKEFLREAEYEDICIVAELQADDDGRFFISSHIEWLDEDVTEGHPEAVRGFIELGFVDQVREVAAFLDHDSRDPEYYLAQQQGAQNPESMPRLGTHDCCQARREGADRIARKSLLKSFTKES